MAHPQSDDFVALREYTDICRQRIELQYVKARIAIDDAIMHALDTSICEVKSSPALLTLMLSA